MLNLPDSFSYSTFEQSLNNFFDSPLLHAFYMLKLADEGIPYFVNVFNRRYSLYAELPFSLQNFSISAVINFLQNFQVDCRITDEIFLQLYNNHLPSMRHVLYPYDPVNLNDLSRELLNFFLWMSLIQFVNNNPLCSLAQETNRYAYTFGQISLHIVLYLHLLTYLQTSFLSRLTVNIPTLCLEDYTNFNSNARTNHCISGKFYVILAL